jgi:predicted RNA-binding protein with PIN domain
VYAGTKSTADDYIKYYIAHQLKAPSNTILVTSDLELSRYARQKHIAQLDSPSFYTILQESHHKPPVKKRQSRVKKYHTDTCNEELDALMESTIVDKPKESMKHFDENSTHKSQDKLTKWERKLLKLVKKL